MTGFRAAGTAMALAGISLTVAACSTIAGTVTHYEPAPAALQDKVDCLVPSEWRPDYGPTDPQARLMGRVPAGFVPVDAVLCTEDFTAPTDTAGMSVRVTREQHFTGDFTALLAALAKPSDKAQGGVSCLDIGELLPNLWLVNAAGKAIHVMWPLDACNFTKPGVRAALAVLHVAKTAEIRMGPQEAQPPKTEPAPIPASP